MKVEAKKSAKMNQSIKNDMLGITSLILFCVVIYLAFNYIETNDANYLSSKHWVYYCPPSRSCADCYIPILKKSGLETTLNGMVFCLHIIAVLALQEPGSMLLYLLF